MSSCTRSYLSARDAPPASPEEGTETSVLVKEEDVARSGPGTSFGIWVPPQHTHTSTSKPAPPHLAPWVNDPGAGAAFGRAPKPYATSRRELFASPQLQFQRLAAKGRGAGNIPNQQDDDDSPVSFLVRYYHSFGGASSPVSHEFYRAYCETTATYSAFLAMVATSYSREKGEPAPVDPVELENLALREVAEQLARAPTAPTDNTSRAVAVLSNVREFGAENELVQRHWAAHRRMIAIRGGIQQLSMHKSLYRYLFWLEGVILSRVRTSIGYPYDGNEVPKDDSSTSSELLAFLSKIHERTPHRSSPLSSPRRTSTAPTNYDRPQHTLTEPITATLSRRPYKSDAYSLAKWRHARLACFVFFAVLARHCGGNDTTESPAIGNPLLLQDTPLYRAIDRDTHARQQRYTMYPEELYYACVLLCNSSRSEDSDTAAAAAAAVPSTSPSSTSTNSTATASNPSTSTDDAPSFSGNGSSSSSSHNNDDDTLAPPTVLWRAARLICAIKCLKRRDQHTCQRVLWAYFFGGDGDNALHDPLARDMLGEKWAELRGRLDVEANQSLGCMG